MAKTHSTEGTRRALSREELGSIHAAVCEINSAFRSLAALADGPKGRTNIPAPLIATIARRAVSLSGGIIDILDHPGEDYSRNGRQRIHG